VGKKLGPGAFGCVLMQNGDVQGVQLFELAKGSKLSSCACIEHLQAAASMHNPFTNYRWAAICLMQSKWLLAACTTSKC
jgi:hypothetical protein